MAIGTRRELPEYLSTWQVKIEDHARKLGLDIFPQVFEVLSFDEMNEVAAFGGFPTRYPHWRWGMDFERLKKSGEWGLSRIYEMVINNNPAVAYLLEGNSLVDQKLVMAHVCGHNDFFKNNFAFKITDQDRRPPASAEDLVVSRAAHLPSRKWIDTFANHATRVRRHIERYGVEKVESFIDVCLSLENLIDPPGRMLEGRPRPAPDSDDEPAPVELTRFETRDYMQSFVNPKEALDAERKKLEAERDRARKFPESPRRDVLQFLLEHAPLERWERDILEIVREESYYFWPQAQTKVMNEGWACIHPESLVFSAAGVLRMADLVGRVRAESARRSGARGSCVSDGADERLVYDCHVIAEHDRVTVRTRRGLVLCGSDNHRVLREDGVRWARLDELSVGDRVKVSGGAGLWASEPVAIRWEPAGPRDARVPDGVTPGVGRLLGALVGGGRAVDGALEFCAQDALRAEAFASLARALFGAVAAVERDGDRWRVIVRSATAAAFVTEGLGLAVGQGGRLEGVVDAVLRSPEPVVRAFVSGLFDCGERATDGGVISSGTSDETSERVQLLLLNFGVLSDRERREDGRWRVRVSGASSMRLAERAGGGSAGWDAGEEERWSDEVVSVERDRGEVYDISVEETHRYAAQGFVNHNSYWHSKIMTGYAATGDEILDYADRNASVLSAAGGRINPYKLGVELYRHIEERWNRGQFGKDWEDCADQEERRHWDLKLDLGRRKIFEARALYTDVTFIDEYLTPEFVIEQKLYSFGWNNRNERFEIDSREFKAVKGKLLAQLTNFGSPFVAVDDANFENRGELLLRHEHQGVDLDVEKARRTLENLVRVWRRPCAIQTIVETRPTLLRFDGKEHATRPMK